ncbi:SPOR domain-containing protein [Solimonas sp. SE-A11]|uniref:SPOR domain-containing protein n=1 Tax=Solimonas sp. SE-A11 TaxID=3054954 RepID=UPI00259CF3DC|nr:SPOR domain-containing protein [Solimonas sp. SE-A11]MDM4771073.1 SPOR domain-containing protein [Solimonas sp. SE-A11]
MNEQLKHRLIGALILLAVALLMAFLLPKPGHVERDDGVRRVTIDLDGGTPPPVAQGDRVTPPVIAAPEPGEDGEPAGDPVPMEGEPEIDESGLAGGDADSRTAAAPVTIRPSDTLAQAAPGRVLPSPGKAPPVQLKQDDSLQGLPAVPAQTAPATAAVPAAKPVAPPPAKPEIAARPKLEPPTPRAPVDAPAARPAVPVAKPEPAPAAPVPVAPKPQPEVAVAKLAEPAKPAGKSRWSVQVGSYAALENARIAESKLKAAGLPTQFGPVDTAKGVLYRVRVGPLADEAAAQAAKAKAVQAGFAQATIRTD